MTQGGWMRLGPAVLSFAITLASGAASADDSSLFSRPWRWRDERDQVVALSKWAGAPLVVTMFFTSCKFRCPRTIDKLREIDAAFTRSHRQAQFVLVTLDPYHDTPDRLEAFKRTAHLPPDTWHLLSGDGADTRALSRLLTVHPAYDDEHINHEVRIGVFDAQGNPTRLLRGWGFDGEEAIQ